MCGAKGNKWRIFARLLLVYMLAIFCAPYTCFDEAQDYLADTESQMVHYYLTPLPDNGEACVAPPVIVAHATITPIRAEKFYPPVLPPLASFFHPPK